MGRIFVTLVVLFVVVGAGLIFQATKGTSSLVLMPSELLTKAPSGNLTRVRIGGRVVDPISYQTDPQMILSFSVKDPKGTEQTIPVIYAGLKPDMFAAGRDVLIDGDYVDGVVKAAKLQTQCPSKYEPVAPGASPSSQSLGEGV